MERAKELFERLKNQGRSGIEEFILTRKAEELFLDFKRSADNGSGQRLNDNDRNNLAKAISGFGNSEGGVIVWGIDCSRDFDGSDVATAEHPITNVRRFVSWLEGVISGCTIPPNTGVQNHPLEIDSEGNGFVVTYIPKSDHAPHQEIPSRRYYIRAGSNFVPIPHDVLAGMFGRRPQPKVKCNFFAYPFTTNKDRGDMVITIGFHICNEGGVIADNFFTSILPLSIGGSKCNWSFSPEGKGFHVYKSLNCVSILSKEDIRLPPGGWLLLAKMILSLQPPFTEELRIDVTFGCGNAPPNKITFANSAENLKRWYEKIFPIADKEDDSENRSEIVNELFGI